MYTLKFILPILIFCSFQMDAQKIFSEGIIKYDIYMNGESKPEGILILTVKNGFTKRETAMNSGFNNIIIYNHKTGITTSLNIDEESKYALAMTSAEVQEKNKRFEKAQFTPIDEKKKLAGYASQASMVKYTSGEGATFYYTTELLPPNASFNMMFPGLQGIPLEYEIKSSASTTIKFVASTVEIKSIDPNVFEIPKDYKIVTKAELENMK